MNISLQARINAFEELGKRLQSLDKTVLDELTDKVRNENPWFTLDNTRMSIEGVVRLLDGKNLKAWLSKYSIDETDERTIALILAGNIPLVGFHDFLTVMLCGYSAKVKLSSKDTTLLPYVASLLITIEPYFENRITFIEQLIKPFDAVIATGSDNSSRYFEFYFGKYPNIIRKNRSSCAILTGKESREDLINLGVDVFSYFGLGCRNVSKLYVPEQFDFTPMLDAWSAHKDVVHHHKYCNNYDYQKSLLLINQVPFLDTGYVMLQESERLVSPISVIYYEFYKDENDLNQKLVSNREKIQVMVGKDLSMPSVLFGQAQFPHLEDYSDGIDTLAFLTSLAGYKKNGRHHENSVR